MADFFAMGGYAQFLWPSYALALLALLANVIIARRNLAAARDEARRRLEVQAEEAE
jgi:heme exporter protein CcmD